MRVYVAFNQSANLYSDNVPFYFQHMKNAIYHNHLNEEKKTKWLNKNQLLSSCEQPTEKKN